MILTLFISLALTGLPCPEPNEQCLNALASNWLRENPIADRQIYIQDYTDANDPNARSYFKYTIKAWQFHPLVIMDLDMDGVINLRDFAILSACYVPSVVIPEPNNIEVEPNDASLGAICYTVGGRHHLYDDCRYIVSKEWIPCLCESDNLCLVCLARKVSE